MACTGKWIEGTHPEQHTSDVVRRALADRFHVLLHFLPLAVKKSSENLEHVHQLRVSTRRTKAALQVFFDFLPKRRRHAIQRNIQRLRRAASDARDLDVLGERLGQIAGERQDGKLVRVLAQIADHRKKAQKSLVAVYQELKPRGWRKQSRALIKRIRWRNEGGEPLFGDTAQAEFRPLVKEFFRSSTELSDIESLHRMRICAKQVRYAMELLVGAFDSSFRQRLYPIFEEVQEKLGGINDHATAHRLFDVWATLAKGTAARSELSRLAADEEQRLETTACAFRNWWTDGRNVDLLHSFEEVLPGIAAAVFLEQESPERPSSIVAQPGSGSFQGLAK